MEDDASKMLTTDLVDHVPKLDLEDHLTNDLTEEQERCEQYLKQANLALSREASSIDTESMSNLANNEEYLSNIGISVQKKSQPEIKAL